jgi:hypothetical protein
METTESIGEQYLEYVLQNLSTIEPEYLAFLEEVVESTNWQNPQTSTDWNNLAVMQLIGAEKTDDLALREQLVNEAFQNLRKGFETEVLKGSLTNKKRG